MTETETNLLRQIEELTLQLREARAKLHATLAECAALRGTGTLDGMATDTRKKSKAAVKTPPKPVNGHPAVVAYYDAFYLKYQCQGCHNEPDAVESCKDCKGRGHMTPTLLPADRQCLLSIYKECGEDMTRKIINNYFATEDYTLFGKFYPPSFIRAGLNVYKHGPGESKVKFNQPNKVLSRDIKAQSPTLSDIARHERVMMPDNILSMFERIEDVG